MATIEGIEGVHKGRRGTLRPGRISIGRSLDCSLSVPDDPSVSRRHASIVFEDGAFYILDENSANGTFLDGRRVGRVPALIQNGSEIRFGAQAFRIHYDRNSSVARVKLPPIQPTLPEQPTATPRKVTAPSAAPYTWYGPGTILGIHGLQIQDPLVYVGTSVVAGKPKSDWVRHGTYDQEELSLVNPTLVVNLAETSDDLPYYPSYFQMTPRQRGTYLRWLAEGRRGDVRARYVSLYIYGLERRMIWRGSPKLSAEEQIALADELEALARRYGHYPAVRTHAIRLAASLWSHHPERVAFDLLDPVTIHNTAPSYPFAFGCLVGHQFNPTHALQWLVNERPKISKKITGARCWPELCALFSNRVEQDLGEGILLHASGAQVSYPKWANNSSLRNESIPNTTVRAASESLQILERLGSICASCMSSLDTYAKRLGPRPSEFDRRRAQIFLPQELRSESALAEAMRSELSIAAEATAPIAWIDFFRSIGIGDDRVRKGEFGIFDLVDELGYYVEPDPRGGFLAADRLGTFVARKAEGDSARPSPGLRNLRLVLWLAASCLGNSGWLTEQTLQGVSNQFEVTELERERANAFAQWLRTDVPKPPRSAIEGLERSARETASRALLTLTRSGQADPDVVKELSRILMLWGWNELDVYSAIHSSDHDLVVVLDAKESGSFKIPAPSQTIVEKTPVKLDMAKVQAKMAETEKVSRILWDVFTEDEPEAVAPIPKPKADKLGPLRTILLELPEGELDASEFGRLVSLQGLLVGATREALNDLAFEHCDAPLLEGDGPFWVDGEILDELRNATRED